MFECVVGLGFIVVVLGAFLVFQLEVVHTGVVGGVPDLSTSFIILNKGNLRVELRQVLPKSSESKDQIMAPP